MDFKQPTPFVTHLVFPEFNSFFLMTGKNFKSKTVFLNGAHYRSTPLQLLGITWTLNEPIKCVLRWINRIGKYKTNANLFSYLQSCVRCLDRQHIKKYSKISSSFHRDSSVSWKFDAHFFRFPFSEFVCVLNLINVGVVRRNKKA